MIVITSDDIYQNPDFKAIRKTTAAHLKSLTEKYNPKFSADATEMATEDDLKKLLITFYSTITVDVCLLAVIVAEIDERNPDIGLTPETVLQGLISLIKIMINPTNTPKTPKSTPTTH